MTSPTQPKPTPAIIVYGTPTTPELTQASWFRAEDTREAKAAAEALKFSVIELDTETDKALTVGVHEGVLKGSGRMIVGSVTTEVYRRIEEYARKASPALAATAVSVEAARAKVLSEQSKNSIETGIAASSTANAPPTAPDKPTPPTPGPRCASVRTSPLNIGTMAMPMVGG